MTALEFYKKRLKDRGFSEKQIKDLTDHSDLPWLQFAENYFTYKNLETIKCMETSEVFEKMKNRIQSLEKACNNAINELELPNSSTEIAIMELKKQL